MRTKEFQKKVEQFKKRAAKIEREARLEFLRKLNESRALYDEAILFVMTEQAKKTNSSREAKP